MYDRYIPPGTVYGPVEEPEASPPERSAPPRPRAQPAQAARPPAGKGDPTGGVPQEVSKVLGGLFRHFSPENLDTGDILLILIVLFLFLEKDDNLDLVIALGLMLLLSLGETEEDGPAQPPA